MPTLTERVRRFRDRRSERRVEQHARRRDRAIRKAEVDAARAEQRRKYGGGMGGGGDVGGGGDG